MLQYNSRKDGITQSLLSGFLKCRQFARHTLDGWTSLKTGGALQFGELAHGVLEDVYGEVRDEKRDVAPSSKEVLKFITRQIDKWEKSPRGQRASNDETQQLEMNTTLLEAVLPHYFKFWGAEDFSKIKWVALEQEFEIEVNVPEIGKVKLRGKMDGLYRPVPKSLTVFETKTKGRIEEQNISDLLAFDFQTDFYSIACGELYGELPTAARYNIIRRPGQKLNKKETLMGFKRRVEEEVVKDPKHYFIRYRIDKPKKDLAVFRKELELKLKDFVDWNEGRLPTYRNETACMDRFGACRFLKICASQNYSGFYKRKKMFEELNVKEVV